MSKTGGAFIWLPPIGLFVLMVVNQGWEHALIVAGVVIAFSVPIAILQHRRIVKRRRNEDPVNRRADMFDFWRGGGNPLG
jgi:peptidoglycan/LPS O-acetylase OafA/YrhL